jgi:hypothetical protein
VVAGVAAANGLMTLLSNEPDPDEEYKFGGTVAAVARSREDFGSLAQSRQWTPKAADPGQWVWTDDYCNIVGAPRFRRRSGTTHFLVREYWLGGVGPAHLRTHRISRWGATA